MVKETKFKRNCPKCNTEIFYKHGRHLLWALKIGSMCRLCGQLFSNKNKSQVKGLVYNPKLVLEDVLMDGILLKPIKNSQGYYAGSDGNIYSFIKKGLQSYIDLTTKPKKLSGSIGTNGYLIVGLKNNDGRRFSQGVHRIVCTEFNGKCPKSFECSHLDGNRLNNKPENLKWESRSDNHKKKKEHGTDDRGYRNSRSKINKEQLIEIRKLLSEKKLTHKEIGELFNVNRVFITKINTSYRYKDC